MIKSENLSEQNEKMVKATCKLTYQDVKSKLKSILVMLELVQIHL